VAFGNDGSLRSSGTATGLAVGPISWVRVRAMWGSLGVRERLPVRAHSLPAGARVVARSSANRRGKCAPLMAPYDDEELSEDDLQAVRQARA